MSPIQDFHLTYRFPNKGRFFSEGDPITGTVTFTLTEDTKVESLHVKASGEGNVSWSETLGQIERTYSAHSKYFKRKEYLLAQDGKGHVLAKGDHRYKFRIQIPDGNFPSSFKGSHGKIVYKLEAKMSRSWRLPSKVQREISFVSRSLSHNKKVTHPRSRSVDKNVGVFSKGEVHLSATVNRKVCSQGDTLSAAVQIRNFSSKTVRPKFSLKQRIVYSASGSTKASKRSLFKGVGDPVANNSEETVSCKLVKKVPDDAIYTINNCQFLSVEYYLKVSLDISFSFNPELLFPVIIVPPSFSTIHPGASGPHLGAVGPHPGPAGPRKGAVGPHPAKALSHSDFSPPAFPTGPDPGPAEKAGSGNAAPEKAAPEKDTLEKVAPSEQDQTYSAPPQQEEPPPSYTSLYPDLS